MLTIKNFIDVINGNTELEIMLEYDHLIEIMSVGSLRASQSIVPRKGEGRKKDAEEALSIRHSNFYTPVQPKPSLADQTKFPYKCRMVWYFVA